jgi:uncharacterized zinc-type alcohol dehydrogenase-like protein
MTSIVRDIINTLHGKGDTSHSADADMREVLEHLKKLAPRAIQDSTVPQARTQPTPADAVLSVLRARGGDTAPAALVPGISSSDRLIPGAAGELPARIYAPQQAEGPLPVIVYFHGGGWVIANKEVYDASARGLAKAAHAIVVSVDYRRAPEAKFPAAWDDALASYRWVAANAGALQGDPTRLALAGESAGGNLALATAIAVRDAGLTAPRAVLAVYPVAQTGNMDTESYDDSRDALPLNKAMIGWFVDKLLERPAQKSDTRLDLINADLAGLPPVTIINAEIDPLRSDGDMLETALREAGVTVDRKLYRGVTHEFFGMSAVVATAREAMQFAGSQLRRAFHGDAASAVTAPRKAFRGALPRKLGVGQGASVGKIPALGYAAKHSFGGLKPFEFERDAARADEIEIAVLYCGVCHSDIHQVRNEWSNTVYPCVPGHEVVGRVTRIGAAVSRHAVGDIVGVGCMIDSCRHCDSCQSGDENYCEGPNSWLATYNGPMVPAAKAPNQSNMYERDNTFGGYSNVLVVSEDFALKIPPRLKPELAAPILCAGATTYSPLKHWGVKPGDRVGIVGFGGLGDMAAKLAVAMGATVTIFTRTAEKLDEAARLGAKGVLEDDTDAFAALQSSFDFILSTVPEKHDVNPYVRLLKKDKTLCVVGALEMMAGVDNQQVAFHRRNVAGSLIGSLEDTQEVLDLCALHGIGPDIEIIDIDAINQAFKKVEDGAVRFRYVIDMASLTADGRRTTTEADAGNTDAAGTPAESSEAEPIIEGALLL